MLIGLIFQRFYPPVNPGRFRENFDNETSVALVVEASFGVDAYLLAKDGQDSAINDCPECGASDTYVANGEVQVCYLCGESVGGDCVRCGTEISIHEYSPDFENLCGWCAHMTAKAMKD